MTFKSNIRYTKLIRRMAVMSMCLLLAPVSLLSLTRWSAEATGFTRRPAEADNSIPALQGAAAITYLKEHKLHDSLMAALNAARTQDNDHSVVATLFNNEQKLTASDGEQRDNFGFTMAASGSTVVIGARFADSLQGAAYVFTRQGESWVETQKLTASDRSDADQFSDSVAISGSTIIVGAPEKKIGSNFTQGAVYVFNRQGESWVETQKLLASDAAQFDGFGRSVAISGSTLVVGEYGHFATPSVPGAVYVFDLHGGNWVETQKLTVNDEAAAVTFGTSVAISGSTLVVGAPFDIIGSNFSQGSAFIFNRHDGIWVEIQKIVASDGALGDLFGDPIAISGSTIVVGAPFDDVNNLNQGSAYVFDRRGDGDWVEIQKLTASDGAHDTDIFGVAVAVSGSTIIVGASLFDVDHFDQGAAFVFKRQGRGWIETQRLTASDAGVSHDFGRGVAVADSTVVAGAPFSNVGHGAAYAFEP